MNRLLRTPRTSGPATLAGTLQDVCGLLVVAMLFAIAALVLP